MARRVYENSVLGWAAQNKKKAVAYPLLLLSFLAAAGLIDISSASGDVVCDGTPSDPCIIDVTFTPTEDVFVYPVGHDPFGRESPLVDFQPGVKSVTIKRRWGQYYRTIDLSEPCISTWCGAPPGAKDNKYSYAFREGREYSIRMEVLKNDPRDVISWSINPEGRLLPRSDYFIGINESLGGSGETHILSRKDSANVEMIRWGGEERLGVSYDMQLTRNSTFNLSVVRYVSSEEEVHAYGKVDGFELEVILLSEPTNNTFVFLLQNYSIYDFFYQAPLDEEENLSLYTCNATDCWNSSGYILLHRPENVVGSYAVYHKEKKGQISGGTNYGTGKFTHIYRPRAFDADNVSTWAEINIRDGLMTVTVPQRFLDNARYPVLVDPTFGYTTIGGSTHNTAHKAHETEFASPSDYGTATNISVYMQSISDSVIDVLSAIYDDSSNTPNNLLAVSSTGQATTAVIQWVNMSISHSGSASTTYHLAADASGNFRLMYDSTAGGNNTGGRDTTTFGSFNDPWTEDTAENRVYSIYLTYTASGGGDTDNPGYSSLTNNGSTATGGQINWSVTLTDDTGLSGYRFAHNQTGTLTNGSFAPVSGTSSPVDELLSITSTGGANICGQFWLNDSSDNQNQTELSCFTVDNTAPVITLIYPSDGAAIEDGTNDTITWSVTDADGDSTTTKVYINESLNMSTSVNVSDWNASEGDYRLILGVTDGTDSGTNTSTITFHFTYPSIAVDVNITNIYVDGALVSTGQNVSHTTSTLVEYTIEAIANTAGDYNFSLDPKVNFTPKHQAHGWLEQSSIGGWEGTRSAANADAITYNTTFAQTDSPGAYKIVRTIFAFNTSSLPDDAVITEANLSIVFWFCSNNTAAPPVYLILSNSTKTNESPLVASEYSSAIKLNNPVGVADRLLMCGQTTGTFGNYFIINLNATGLGVIDPFGVTSFSLRTSQDVDNVTPTNNVDWRGGENFDRRETPILSVFYTEASSAKSGLISTVAGTTPFFTTNTSNPAQVTMGAGVKQNITFLVNASGTIDSIHEFFAYVNYTEDLSVSDESVHWNVTIINVTAQVEQEDVHLCAELISDSGLVTNGSARYLINETCDLGTDSLTIRNVSHFEVSSLGQIYANGCYVLKGLSVVGYKKYPAPFNCVRQEVPGESFSLQEYPSLGAFVDVNMTGRAIGFDLMYHVNATGTSDEFGGVVVENDIIYTAGKQRSGIFKGTNKTTAIWSKNGSIIWQSEQLGPIDGTPLIDNNDSDVIWINVYFSTTQPDDATGTYKLNKTTGEKLCNNTSPLAAASSNTLEQSSYLIFDATQDNRIFAYNKTDCSTVWNVNLAQGMVMTPLYHDFDDHLLVSTDQSKVRMMWGNNGSTIWERPIGGTWDSQPSYSNGINYLTIGKSGTVFGIVAFNHSTGSSVWNVSYAGNHSAYTQATLYNGYVWVGRNPTSSTGLIEARNMSTGALHCEIIPQKVTDSQIYQGPAIAGSTGYGFFGTLDGYLFAFNTSNCGIIWKHQLGDLRAVYSNPAISKGKIYFNADDWFMWGYNIGNGTGEWTRPAYNEDATNYCVDCLTDFDFVESTCVPDSTNFTCAFTNHYSFSISANLTANSTYLWWESGSLKEDDISYNATLTSGQTRTFTLEPS